MSEGTKMKAAVDAFFDKAGTTVEIRKYNLAASSYTTMDMKAVFGPKAQDIQGRRGTYTNPNTNITYNVFWSGGTKMIQMFVPYTTAIADFLKETTGNEWPSGSGEFRKNAIIWKDDHNEHMWWFSSIIIHAYGELNQYFEMSGPALGDLNRPGDWKFDAQGFPKVKRALI